MTSADVTILLSGGLFLLAIVCAGFAAHADEVGKRESEKVWVALGSGFAVISAISFFKWLILAWPWFTW